MERIRESPWTIRLAAILSLAAIWGPVPFNHGSAPLETFVGAFVLTAILWIFVLRGSRVAWLVALVLTAAGAIGFVVSPGLWHALLSLGQLIAFALLLAPASRRHVWGRIRT